MASPFRPPPPPGPPAAELELTIVSAKHLKNVNWKTGDLKPYCVFWVDPTRRLSTKSDDSGSTRPIWNERFNLPLPDHPSSLPHLTLEVFHSKPSETPKPLVGTLRIPLKDLPHPEDSPRLRTFDLARPSGRPQGKIKIKIGIRQRDFPPPPHPQHHYQDYHFVPPQSYYFNSATPPPSQPPPPPCEYNRYTAVRPQPSSPYGAYPYYPGYFPSVASTATPSPRPFYYGGAPVPSAPVDVYSPYEQRQRGLEGKAGFGTGLAVGAVAGALGGLALEEGLKHEEEKVPENDFSVSARDDYSDYRADY